MKLTLSGLGALSGIALALMFGFGYRVQAADTDSLRTIREQLQALSKERAPVEGWETPLAGLRGNIRTLELRVAELETPSPGGRVAVRETESIGEAQAQQESTQGTVSPLAINNQLELEGLIETFTASGWDYSGSSAEFERFLELAREGTGLKDMIAELEARVAADPTDLETRLSLADSYTGMLMTVSGPEQGMWGGRAEQQWVAITQIDDNQWRPHSALGTNYAYYPEVMNKTGDAVRHLERAREIQRQLQPLAQHVQTYLFLARMYERNSKTEEARGALLEGLQSHPGHAELQAALQELE